MRTHLTPTLTLTLCSCPAPDPAPAPVAPQVIADSETDGGLAGACDKFKAWVDKTYLASA